VRGVFHLQYAEFVTISLHLRSPLKRNNDVRRMGKIDLVADVAV
jgi:hypothetical protein